jgi:hypothetical protein
MKPGLRLAVSLCSMRPMSRRLFLLAPAFLLAGCIHVKMDPIHVHATLDVNVKIEQAVNDLLADIYAGSSTVKVP